MHFSVYPKKSIFFLTLHKTYNLSAWKNSNTRVTRSSPDTDTHVCVCVCVCVKERLCIGSKSCSDVTDVQVSLFYPPVRWHVLRFVALHVLLHGGQARAEVLADGALVWRGSVVSAQVLDHSRVVSGPLVTQLTLEWLLTWKIQQQSINLVDPESEACQVKRDSPLLLVHCTVHCRIVCCLSVCAAGLDLYRFAFSSILDIVQWASSTANTTAVCLWPQRGVR